MLDLYNTIALAIFLLCFIGYHIFYFYLMKKYPHITEKSYIDILREDGIAHMIETGKQIVVIQALRDVIMICNLFASSTFIFIGLMLNLSINIDKIAKNMKIWNFKYFEFKILVIIGILIFAFICLISALRYYRLLAILVMARPETIEKQTCKSADKYLGSMFNIGCTYYTLGSRGLIYSLLILVWLINTWLFIGIVLFITLLFAISKDFHFCCN